MASIRGPSPWKRAVREGAHVLICPTCQADHDWQADLDHCPTCTSWRLARALGQVTCRDCGVVVGSDAEAGLAAQRSPGPASDLAGEVEAALARLRGSSAAR